MRGSGECRRGYPNPMIPSIGGWEIGGGGRGRKWCGEGGGRIYVRPVNEELGRFMVFFFVFDEAVLRKECWSSWGEERYSWMGSQGGLYRIPTYQLVFVSVAVFVSLVARRLVGVQRYLWPRRARQDLRNFAISKPFLRQPLAIFVFLFVATVYRTGVERGSFSNYLSLLVTQVALGSLRSGNRNPNVCGNV